MFKNTWKEMETEDYTLRRARYPEIENHYTEEYYKSILNLYESEIKYNDLITKTMDNLKLTYIESAYIIHEMCKKGILLIEENKDVTKIIRKVILGKPFEEKLKEKNKEVRLLFREK